MLTLQDAVHDGLRAVKNALEDGCVVPGAGSYEVAVHIALKKAMEQLKGRERLGVQAYADGMLVIPKVLATNAGRLISLIILMVNSASVWSAGFYLV